MADNLNKLKLAGIGAFSLTKKGFESASKKLHQAYNKLAKEGGASQKQFHHFKNTVAQKFDFTKKFVGKQVQAGVRSSLRGLGVPTKTQFAALERRVARIESEMRKMK